MKIFQKKFCKLERHFQGVSLQSSEPKHYRISSERKTLRRTSRISTLLFSTLLLNSVVTLIAIKPAQAAPKRTDWCNILWSLESNPLVAPFSLASVSPNNGASSSVAPNANITMPTNNTGNAAAIGIHVQSGTLFAFDRNGTGQLYKYRFGVDTQWQTVSTTGLKGFQSTPSTNLNKMTVDGDFLYITDSSGSPIYSFPVDPTTGTLTNSTATVTKYTYTGIPVGAPTLDGGDITTDEYGDTYNVTYGTNTTTGKTDLYFFKQDLATNTWVYQGRFLGTDNGQFAGAAFYKGDLFVKSTTGSLRKVDLTRVGNGYTGWSNLTVVGTSNGSTDLAACGTPQITINKTRKLYTDADATTLAPNQNSVKTGQYIKYIITAKNTGTAWGRTSTILDNLPVGTSYVPNSATLNGTNLNLATYPTSGFLINSPGAGAGIIRFAPDPDTATLTFVVQVTSTSGSVQNRATITYIDNGVPSEPSDCSTTPKFNCGEDPGTPLYPSINGTVWNDSNTSITIDGSPIETGTNAGGLTVYAVGEGGLVVSKATVNADGTYTLTNLPPNTTVTVRLSTNSSVEIGNTAPANASLPSSWTNTGENKNGITETTGLGEISVTVGAIGSSTPNQNFGIKQVLGALNCSDIYGFTDDTASSYLEAYNTASGQMTRLVTMGPTVSSVTLGIDPITKRVYYFSGATTNPELFYYDATTGINVGTGVNAPSSTPLLKMGFDKNGIGYAINSNWAVYSFNTAATPVITNLGTIPGMTGYIGGDIAFDDAGRLWILTRRTSDDAYVLFRAKNVGGTWTATLIGAILENKEPVQGNSGAIAFNSAGDLYIARKGDGQSWKVNVNDATATIVASNGAPARDLASCAIPTFKPNVLLVKRITQINRNNLTINGQNLTSYNQDSTNPYDDNFIEPELAPAPPNFPTVDTDKWPNTTANTSSTFLLGGIDGGYVKPNDEVEYTIYFISTGHATEAKNVLFCDKIPDNQTFVANTYNNIAPSPGGNNLAAAPGGLAGSDRGISVLHDGKNYSYTSIGGDDSAEFYPPGRPLPTACNGTASQTQDNGAIVVNLGDLPNATAPGEPAGSYGFVRFRVKIR